MSATLSAQAEGEKTAGPSKPKVDNPAPVTARLRRLAIIHQRAVISRAMRLAGIHGHDRPTLESLAIAEAPPPLWFRVMESCGPHGVPINAAEYEHGKKMATRWRTALDALDGILAHAEERIPDLALAAMPEPDLKRMADAEAKDWRSALEVTLKLDPRPYTPEERRAMCPDAQVRRLRRKAAAARQHAAALFGTVGAEWAPYADDYSMERWKERQATAAAFAVGMVLVTASGKTVPMSDIMANSKKAALARLYAMTKGMDGVAVRQGWAAAFLTITLPPEYHPNPCKGANGYDPYLSPAQADTAMAHLVSLLRARMAKAGIPTFGVCVKEPHRDGCPHTHILAYMPAADIPRVDAMLQEMRPEPVKGERIATECKTIDRDRAAPTTYVFKYLMKAMSAPATGGGDKAREDGDHLTNHDRVRAWASERGLRRWAVWGTHGVQRAWQALQQRDTLPEDAPEDATEAWKAIKERRYADALHAMGAVRGSGTPRVRLAYETVETAYGDTRQKATGITVEGTDWTMPLKQRESRIVSVAELLAERKERDEEAAFEARRQAMADWKAAHAAGNRISHPAAGGWGAVTVVDSYPRGPTGDSVDGGGTGRTGPPLTSSLAEAHGQVFEVQPQYC